MDENDSISMISNDVDEDDDYGDIANKVKLRPNLTTESFIQQGGPSVTQQVNTVPQGPQYCPQAQFQTRSIPINNQKDDIDNESNCDDQSIGSNVSNESEKLDFLMKLDRFKSSGQLVRDFNLKSSLLEIKKETHRIEHAINMKSSIKFQQKMLMAIVSGLEYANKRFDPFSIELDGWSENVFENIEDFNTVFERLYEKYRRRGEMSPELELLLTLAGSAFMFNMSNQLFKSVNNSLNDPMKSLRESIKTAFNQTQQTSAPQQPTSVNGPNGISFSVPTAFNQTQQTSAPQQPGVNSTNGISFSVPTFQNINGLNATNATNNPNNHFNNLNNIQLETLKQQQTQKLQEMEHVDDDRFSISSSTDSIFEQHTQQNQSNIASKKPRNSKKVVSQRTLVI